MSTHDGEWSSYEVAYCHVRGCPNVVTTFRPIGMVAGVPVEEGVCDAHGIEPQP